MPASHFVSDGVHHAKQNRTLGKVQLSFAKGLPVKTLSIIHREKANAQRYHLKAYEMKIVREVDAVRWK